MSLGLPKIVHLQLLKKIEKAKRMIDNDFFFDSFNECSGQFKNHPLSISQPFIGAVLNVRSISEPPTLQYVQFVHKIPIFQFITKIQSVKWVYGR